jgi:hypothetical protein
VFYAPAVSALDALAPDQRAVVQLVLGQRRSYEELATMLGISLDAVRTRAHAGLAALGNGVAAPEGEEDVLADYLLGQGDEEDNADAVELLEESPQAREWAGVVAAALATVPNAQIPAIPGAPEPDAAPDAEPGARVPTMPETAPAEVGDQPVQEPAARPARRPAAPSSKIGGALLIGVLAALVIAALIFLLGGDDPANESTTGSGPTPTPAATSTAAPATPVAETDLKAPSGGRAAGLMTLFLEDGRLAGFSLEAQNVPPNKSDDAYAVWFVNPGGKAENLGFANPVDQNGVLAIQGPQEADVERFPRMLANYRQVVVSRETDPDAKRPGKIVLRGRLPGGE